MIRALWSEHRSAILRVAIVLLAAAALFRLTHEYWSLLFDPGIRSAHDLRSVK